MLPDLELGKTLAGEWDGTFEWSQGRTGSGNLRVSYYLTGGGSALVENLVMGSTVLRVANPSCGYYGDGWR